MTNTTMSNTPMEFRVNELNRILPMVEDTMALKERNFDLGKKCYKFNTIREALVEKINSLEKTLSFAHDLPDIAILCMQNYLMNHQAELECLDSFIEVMKDQNSFEEAKLDLDNNLYFAICSSIAIDGGFLNSSEIQEEFIPCYIHLLTLTHGVTHCITMKTLFKGKQSVTAFLDLLHAKYSKSEVEKILADINRYN